MTSLSDPRAPAEGTVLDGRFRLRRFLAQGGMGAVYEAEGPAGERLAVKVLLDTSASAHNSGSWARFVREAQVSSSLSSPHIVQVFGGGLDPVTGTAYLAMEFLEGEDLDTLLGRVGPLHPQVAVRLIRQAARGLQVAHEAGIVHRDIKPSNLFLERHNGEIVVKVCDFGIAKVQMSAGQQQLTGTGHVLGSPVYMAPEQVLSSKGVDGRADVWSLAMTLYHALAGQAPLAESASFTELVLALTTQPVAPLQPAAPWVVPGLAAVVHGALLRDPEARCPSVAEFMRALAPHGGGDDDVTAGMLVGMPDDLRRGTAPSSLPPSSWYEAKAQNQEADPMLGKVLVGKYTLQRPLGEGGMGAVYEATTPQGDAVACKVLRPDLVGSSPDAMRRLVREARTAMKITDPHVVHTLEVDTDMTLGMPFIAMELLRGLDLSALLEATGPLDPAAVCRLFIDAGQGLAAAHRLGIVHRDIKPANLFLHQVGGAADPLVVKVCDFGIAKQTETDAYGKTSTELTRTGGMLGSPLYMSPEQAKNAKGVDHRSDLWSFCMAMYEAFAGQKAWRGFNSPGELVLAICTQDIPPLQDVAPWLPAATADAVHRGLRRDPAERYQSVDELLVVLAPMASSCPVLTLEALRSLSESQRLVIAERSPRSRRSVSPGATSVDSTRDVEPSGARPSPLGPRLAGAIAVAAVLAAGAGWVLRGPSAPTAVIPVPALPASDQKTGSSLPTVQMVAAPPLVVRVPVQPPGARVSIKGEARPLDSGALELSGGPGESFTVLVEADGARREVQITLTKDGHAIPPTIDLPTGKTTRLEPLAGAGGKSGKPAVSAPTPVTTPTQATTRATVGNGAAPEWRE